MNVTPTSPQGTPSPSENPDPQYQSSPNKQFPQDLKGKTHPKDKDEHKKKQIPHPTKSEPKFEGSLGTMQFGLEGVVAGKSAATGSASSAIDRIVQVFQTNPLFGAGGINAIRVSEQGDHTIIGVSLENGVEVNINLAPGGKELNITVAGLTAAAQALADKPENQLLLRDKLSEQGFTIHQIQTSRADVLTTALPQQIQQSSGPQASEGRSRDRGEDKGDGGGRGGQQEESGGKKQPR